MRKIRYECKVQNVKKRKVTINISVDGVRVTLKKKKRKKKQQQQSTWTNDADTIELMQYPIYRIFYVSHDSSDLKIFSYIARDGSTDTFKCSVFKSNKKSQAMRIVRTVGQAFEVCHKFNLQKNSIDHTNDNRSETPCDELSERCSDHLLSDDDEPNKEPIPASPEQPTSHQMKRPNHLDIISMTNFNNIQRKSPADINDPLPCGPLSTTSEMQQLREQLEQQALQTRQALNQLMMVREQLLSETNARIEAQARTQQLLQQNRELIEHLTMIGGGYNENERPGLTAASIGLAPQQPLSLMYPEHDGSGSPIRKSFLPSQSPNNNSMSLSLGTINQQLNTLSQQLSGLNQQSQNLQNFQNLGTNFQSLLPVTHQPTTAIPSSTAMLMTSTGNNNSAMNGMGWVHDLAQQQDLFQSNQELLNRLQNLSLGYSNNNSINQYSPHNSFMYHPSATNSQQSIVSGLTTGGTGNLHNNNNSSNIHMNLLNTPTSMGNLTPSPILNRSASFSSSPLMDRRHHQSMERNLDRSSGSSSAGDTVQFIRPLSQVGTLTTLDTDGTVKVLVPVSDSDRSSQYPSTSSINLQSAGTTKKGTGTGQPDKRVTMPDFVTLRVTDESGNVTNTRKLSATPTIITRSTSEKVPNRSQMMSEVQRTAWARHTTK